MLRAEANKEILKTMINFFAAYPDTRFGQGLICLGLVPDGDFWNKESVVTLTEISSHHAESKPVREISEFESMFEKFYKDSGWSFDDNKTRFEKLEKMTKENPKLASVLLYKSIELYRRVVWLEAAGMEDMLDEVKK